jgi:CheY-like chemotaxis protein
MSRVLIVDDQPSVRKALRWYFEEGLSVECLEAADGLEGVQTAERERPDLIILDFSMPVMDGAKAAAILHQISPATPVLVLTSHSGVVDEIFAGTGVCGIFCKDNVEPLVEKAKLLLQKPLKREQAAGSS